MGFEQSPHEAAVYRWGNGGNVLLVGVYVDDLVITGTKDVEVATFKEEMNATFQMSDMGPLFFYLGIEVHQDDSGITLRQIAYAKRVIELAGLTDCNPALTPMEEKLKLSRDSTTEEVDATQYWSGGTPSGQQVRSGPGQEPRFPWTEQAHQVRHHFIRGCLEEGSIKAGYINTKDQLADLLTKPLGRIRFLELCSKTGMVQISHKTPHKT
jgi:hypothetical protein